MRIRFLRQHKVQQNDGKGPVYERDQVYDFPGAVDQTYARKYIARGLAVEEPPEGARTGGKKGKGKPEGETVAFRKDGAGEAEKVYVLAPWPKLLRVDHQLVEQADGTRIVASADRLTFNVDNGLADYRIGAAGPDGILCELIEGTFDPPPEPIKAPDA